MSLQSIMNWAKSHPGYNSDSKLFFFSFVAFASGQITSYPLAVIRTQQQAQGNIYIMIQPQSDYSTQRNTFSSHLYLSFFQLSAQIHVQPLVLYEHFLGYMKEGALEDIIMGWEPALSGLFPVLW